MITCSVCKHWRRQHYNNALWAFLRLQPEQIKWGNCDFLPDNDQEFFIAYVDADDESLFCTTVETKECFGCAYGEPLS